MEQVSFLTCGDCAVTVAFPQEIREETNRRIRFLAARIQSAGIHGVQETVPTFCSLTVYYDPLVLPADGVYVTYLETDGSIFPAVTNVGNNPTVGGSEKGIETHILDFDGELYGRFVRVRFVKRLRGEKRFGSLDELRNQIATDVRDANHYFGKDV